MFLQETFNKDLDADVPAKVLVLEGNQPPRALLSNLLEGFERTDEEEPFVQLIDVEGPIMVVEHRDEPWFNVWDLTDVDQGPLFTGATDFDLAEVLRVTRP